MEILEKNAGERRTFHPRCPSDGGDRLVRWCYFFYLRRDADSTTQLTAAKSVSNSQSFSDLDTVDDSCVTDDRRDGIFYCCLE